MKKYLLILALALGANLTAADDTMHAGRFVWNELATKDVKAAKDFYGKVFGWTFTEKKAGDMNYTVVKSGDKDIAGIWAIPNDQQKQIPTHWLAYISVDDLKQSLEKVQQSGGIVLKPAQTIEGMGQFAIVQDPTGAHFALWQTLKK